MKQLPICWLTSLCPFLTTITTLLTLTETFHCSLTVNTFEPPVSDNLKTQAVSFGRMAAYESLVHMIGHRRLKEKQNLKVVAVVYERWALTIGFQYLYSDLTRNAWYLGGAGEGGLQEVVATKGSAVFKILVTAIIFVKKS